MKRSLAFVAVLTTATIAYATTPPVDIPAQTRRAPIIVVATVDQVEQGRFAVVKSGDRLIVTRSWLRVEETLKGDPQQLIAVDVEGGTVDDVTLSVSDLPTLRRGERGLFFLQPTGDGATIPSGRGHGILKVDSNGRVLGVGLQLGDVESAIRAALQ